MSVLLICDAPNCVMTIPAVVRLGRAAAPDNWWMQANASGRLIVACCEKHVAPAMKYAATIAA
jgi:hypothetical protein